jgi:hypothetical protein
MLPVCSENGVWVHRALKAIHVPKVLMNSSVTIASGSHTIIIPTIYGIIAGK